jgi:3-hexulose-6-phosphate synthase
LLIHKEKYMKLQIALDLQDSEKALAIVDQIHDIIDIVEVGTPLVLHDGMVPVRLIKEKYPRLTVLADTKIVDGGGPECADACKAGADIVTVLALAANETIEAAVKAAHQMGRKVLADLISVGDIPRRAREIEKLGVDYIGVHTAFDVQGTGRTPLGDLKELVSAVPAEKAAVAGGVKLAAIPDYKALNPAIIIAGGALTGAPDIRKAVEEMKAAIES